jgi:hypothetical protein
MFECVFIVVWSFVLWVLSWLLPVSEEIIYEVAVCVNLL